jgi:hypothetical protein
MQNKKAKIHFKIRKWNGLIHLLLCRSYGAEKLDGLIKLPTYRSYGAEKLEGLIQLPIPNTPDYLAS